MLVKKKKSNPFLVVALGSFLLLLILLSLKGGNTKTAKVIPEITQKTNYNYLQVILNEKHFESLKAKRDEAVSIGVLQTSDDDYVPATIRYNTEDYKADLRLKGDWTDHLKGDKWSYRIKLKNDRTIHGMRKFSVHHPGARGYLNEWLFHKVVKDEEMMGLRYEFLEGFLHINLKKQDTALTKAVGVYAIEETFDNRLIENNKRKVGVILKFTEDNIWRETAKVYQVSRSTGTSIIGKLNPKYSSETKMTITAFSLEKIMADEALKKQFTLAKNLLNHYKNGDLKISEVFDVEMTARYTAIANLFGGLHGLTTHNLRFFYNPITSRMEPIAFDNNSGTLLKEFKYYWNSTKDPAFMQAQIKALEEISAPEYLEHLIAKYQTELNGQSSSLKEEFPKNEILSIDVLKKNQEMMRNTLEYLHNTIGKNSKK
ncbi:MAG: hypothetical protein AB8B59_02895 [Maribacter sp.]